MDVRVVSGGPNACQFIIDFEVQGRAIWPPLHVVVCTVGGEEEHEPIASKPGSPGQLKLFARPNHGALSWANQFCELVVGLRGRQESPSCDVCGTIGDVPNAQDVGFWVYKGEAKVAATWVPPGVRVGHTQRAAFVGREEGRHIHAFPVGRLAHNGDGLRAEVESPILSIHVEETIGRRVFKRHEHLLRIQSRDGVARHLVAWRDAGDGALGRGVLFTKRITTGPFNSRLQRIGFHQGMEHEGLACGGGVAIAHDGARPHGWPVGTATFRRSTVVDCTSWPPAPVGVVGAEVVAQFMRDHVQVPGIAVDVVVGGVGQVGTEAVGIGPAVDVEPSDASCSSVGPLGDQVGHVPLN